jgi:hypothetical protein
MRSTGLAALTLLLTASACVHDPSPSPARADQYAGSDISGAAANAPNEPQPMVGASASAIAPDESEGGAECLTADGAPYVAPKC